MPLSDFPPEDCLRAREQISLYLDSELSEFEQGVLQVHLAICGSCAMHSARLRAMTETLREAAPVEPAVVLLRIPRRRSRFALHPAAAATAMAVVAVTIGGLVNLSAAPYHRATVDLRSTQERMSVKERQLQALEGENPRARGAKSPTGLDPGTGMKSSFSGVRAQAAWR